MRRDESRSAQRTTGRGPPPPHRPKFPFLPASSPPTPSLQNHNSTNDPTAYRYARALAAAVSARRRPLALRAALALPVARPGRLLAPPAGPGGSGGVRPAALAARLVQLSETLGISVADAAELLAGAAGPEDDEEEEEEGDDDDGAAKPLEGQQRRSSRRRAAGGASGRATTGPPAASLEDVLPLRLLRAAEALVAALELDLNDDDDEEEGCDDGEEDEERGAGGGLLPLPLPPWLQPASPSSSVAVATPYSLPPEPPVDDARAVSLRLAVRAVARRPTLLDASPLEVRRRAAAAAAALGLPPRLAARRLVAREPALLDVAPDALAKRLKSMSRALGGAEEEEEEQEEEQRALALALVLREPRLLLPPARALAANLAALPGVLLGGARDDEFGSFLPLLLLHAPFLALVPASELARRLEALRRLLPPPAPPPGGEGGGQHQGPAQPPRWPPRLRTACGLEYDPRLLTLAPARLAERARHLQRLERLAAAAAGGGGEGAGGRRDGAGSASLRQRRARLLAVPSAALDGWCADARHFGPAGGGEAVAAATAAAKRLLEEEEDG